MIQDIKDMLYHLIGDLFADEVLGFLDCGTRRQLVPLA
jgi:hypothetical protein